MNFNEANCHWIESKVERKGGDLKKNKLDRFKNRKTTNTLTYFNATTKKDGKGCASTQND